MCVVDDVTHFAEQRQCFSGTLFFGVKLLSWDAVTWGWTPLFSVRAERLFITRRRVQSRYK